MVTTAVTQTAIEHNDRGVSYHVQYDMENAIREYKQALQIEPDFIEARNNLGAAYYMIGKIELGIIEWQKALELNWNICEIHHNLACAYKAKGAFDLAIGECKEALRLNDGLNNEDYDTHFVLATVYEIIGDKEMAIHEYFKCIETAPFEDVQCTQEVEEKISHLKENK